MKGYYHYVEDVLNGKIVVGDRKDIQEVKNEIGYLF